MTTLPFRRRSPLWDAILIAIAVALTLFAIIGIGRGDDALTPARRGMVVDIADCKIAWRIWTDTVSIRCDYRIDEGEWRHVQSGEAPGNPDVMLPGTSVHLAIIDEWFYAQHEEDVRELRWLSDQ